MSDERFVIAFYGVKHDCDINKYVACLCEWFISLGFPPDKMGFAEQNYECPVMDFTRASARLKRRELSKIVILDMHASRPNASVAAADYYASSAFCRLRYSFAVVAVPGPRPLRSAILSPAKRLARILSPSYGIGYPCDLKAKPIPYALGIGHGLGHTRGKDYERARAIARWCDVGIAKEVYRSGLLRDIYPLNFLSPNQLARSVGNASLRSWIGEDASRGTLQPFEGDMFLWEVQEDRIDEVRESLNAANAIFDWRKDQGIPT